MAEFESLDIRDETQKRIERAFLSLYKTTALENISVTKLIEQVPCSRNTFYRYFHSIENLLEYLERENTCTKVCQYIIENNRIISLTDAADLMAEFYEERKEALLALCSGTFRERYIERQSETMKPMFMSLISRAFDLTPMQLDYLCEYIARGKASMVLIWVEKGFKMSLEQINKMLGTVLEESLWTQVALQSPDYGGPQPLIEVEHHRFGYPWEIQASNFEESFSTEVE